MGTLKKQQPRAVALISGGLDSMLAAKVVANQGVIVEGVNFFTGFCVEGHTQAIRRSKNRSVKRHSALWVAEQIGIKLQIVDIAEEYKEIVLNPKHGYGRLLNPCLDCKIFMVQRALELTSSDGKPFDFVVSGEIIGQRPKSQRAETMPIIAKESGANDRLLRPLCAKALTPTLPERMGWVDRDELFDYSGRTRKPQMALAEQLGITEYAQPAGGCCFLTDETYTNKLEDLWRARARKDYDIEDVVLLKTGRHVRPSPKFKLIIGREDSENRFLRGFRHHFTSLETISHKGPLALFDGEGTVENIELATRIVSRYSQGRSEPTVTVRSTAPDGVSQEFEVTPMAPHEIREEWQIGL